MLPQTARYALRLLPPATTAVLGAYAADEQRTAHCQDNDSHNPSKRPMAMQLGGRDISAASVNVTPAPHTSTSPAFYITLKNKQTHSIELESLRCKYQEFSHERMNEALIGKLYHLIDEQAPRTLTLTSPQHLVRTYYEVDSTHCNCSQLLPSKNLQAFFEQYSLSSLSQDDAAAFIADLVAWIRLDMALGKDIYLDNYLVLEDGKAQDSNTEQVRVISVDHESAGEFNHSLLNTTLGADSTMPTVEACLSKISDTPSQRLESFLRTPAVKEKIEQRSNVLLTKFANFSDLKALEQEIRREFGGEARTDLANALTLVRQAQANVHHWLSQRD